MTETISPMLEKVEHALIKEWDSADFDPTDAAAWSRLARAAVQALMDPDEAMMEAVEQVPWDGSHAEWSYNVCRAMLTQVLDHRKGE